MIGVSVLYIALGNVAFDRSLKVNASAEAATLRPAPGQAEKKPSTTLNQEAEVGVEWNTQRGWRDSQVQTFA